MGRIYSGEDELEGKRTIQGKRVAEDKGFHLEKKKAEITKRKTRVIKKSASSRWPSPTGCNC